VELLQVLKELRDKKLVQVLKVQLAHRELKGLRVQLDLQILD
jgi:hypothetical protein